MKLLIIDDNSDITDVIKFYCEGKNIECQIANNASEGLATINNNKFDLVLLDLAMPEFTGFDLINNLKSRGMLDKSNIEDRVKSAEVFIPQRGRIHQDWIIREIENRIKTIEKNFDI